MQLLRLKFIPRRADFSAMIEGARTPALSHDELRNMGYRVVIHPNLTMRVAARAIQSALAVLQKTRGSELLIPHARRERAPAIGAPP